jgi:selenocysteine lyase/cysteine desulfurase
MLAAPKPRRRFLLELAGGAALLSNARPARGLAAATEESGEEAYWELVRRQFAFREERVPMNAANLCPSPRVVAETVSELTREVDVDCSFQNRARFDELREQARRKIAAHLDCGPDEIAIVRNTSEANNTVNNGLALRSGDEVVVWDQNHATNNVAWDVRAARFGLRVRRVATPPRPTGAAELIAPFEQALGPATRALALTHLSNVSGVRLPIRELSELAHRRGIYVHVDGAQTCGALDVSLRELGCDSYTASAHKWLVGPKEAGILFVRSERVAEIWPNSVAPGWGDDAEPDPVGARKFESLGQRDDACIAALEPTLDFHAAIGAARVEARVLKLAAALKAGLREQGLELVTPEPAELSGGVCIVKAAPAGRRELLDRLYYEHGIAGAPTGGLRLCPHVYNTMEHVERALRGVRALRSLLA